jgi:hypothetical protein
MNIKIPKLENIFLLLGIIPLLKNNSTLSYKINNKGIYKLFKKILNKKIKYKVIKLDYNYLLYFNKIMKVLNSNFIMILIIFIKVMKSSQINKRRFFIHFLSIFINIKV